MSGQGCFKRLVYHGQYPLLYIDDCSNHFDLGLLVGSTFAKVINERIRVSIAFAKVQAYCSTNWGRQLLAALKDTHRVAFPLYYAELMGTAAGAELPLDTIFMLNLRQEILAAGDTPGGQAAVRAWLAARRQRQQATEQQATEQQELGADAAAVAAAAARLRGGGGGLGVSHDPHGAAAAAAHSVRAGGSGAGSGHTDGLTAAAATALRLSELSLQPEHGSGGGGGGGGDGASASGDQPGSGEQRPEGLEPAWGRPEEQLERRRLVRRLAQSLQRGGCAADLAALAAALAGAGLQEELELGAELGLGLREEEAEREPEHVARPGAGREEDAEKVAEQEQEAGQEAAAGAEEARSWGPGSPGWRAAGGGQLRGDLPIDDGGGGGGGVRGPDVDPASVDACSDVAVRLLAAGDAPPGAPPRLLLLGHNEDMTNDTLGRVYFVRASMPGRAAWFALTYAGELASTAFGANTAGVAFTLNALYPTDALLPGLGRNFLSRRLLDAGSEPEALAVLGVEGQATGRSVNLMCTQPGRQGVVNVEVGPGGSYDLLQLRAEADDWYFHANAYDRLPQPQKTDNSSVHRTARAAQFPLPGSAHDVLAILGDTADTQFPIYRTGDYGGLVFTLCTVLFDLLAGTMTVFHGNPNTAVAGSVLSLSTLLPRGAWAEQP